jgi:hypothetical protein
MTDPSSRQRGRPKIDRTATFTKYNKEMSGDEPQMGLGTKTDRLTDRQL